MQLSDITLDVLLSNQDISKISINNIWYFKYSDVNFVYDNQFKYIEIKLIKEVVNGIKKPNKYIAYPVIEEHVNFIKKRASFEENIDKALGINPKK